MNPFRKAAVIALIGALAACDSSTGQEPSPNSTAAKYVKRIAGCAESVDGFVYSLAGMTLARNIPDVGAYNPSNKTWAAKAPIPTPRATAGSAVLGKEIYVAGGRAENDIVATTEKYLPAENRWQQCAPMPTPRWSLMVCAVGGKLYALGGISGTGNNRRALGVVEAYDPKTDSWESVGQMPDRRQGAAIAVADDLVYVISGKMAAYAETSASEPITERVDCFNPKKKTWTRAKEIPVGRVGAKAIVAHGVIFVAGGIGKTGEFPKTIHVLDPKANEWTAGPELPTGRSGHMCALAGVELIVFGGSAVAYGATTPSICSTLDTLSTAGYHKTVIRP